jgi:LPXTG-site transpeptidase (sortase) family protein
LFYFLVIDLEESMKRKIASIVTFIVGMMLLVNPGFAVRAQVLSFPAEINKSFTPISIPSGGISRLIVTIYNPNSFPLSNASWTDNLVGVQPGLSIANPANISNSCGGSVTAVPGTTTLSLSGGTVPAQVGMTPGECTVGINVTSTTFGNQINTIPANALSSTGGGVSITNTTPASATLTVLGVSPPSVNKSFSPNTIFVGETSLLSVTINNNSPSGDLTGASLTDNLPANVVIADPALPSNSLSNCGASATLSANPGATSFTLNNATITPSQNCIVRVYVTSTTSGVYTNTIPANALDTDQGLTNSSPTSDVLTVQAVGVEKSFSPPSFQAGGTSTLTITLQNPTGSAYTNVGVTDTLPGTVLTLVDGSAATTCGGAVSITQPRTVTLSGGTIPASSSPPTPPGTCTITVQVTAPADASAATFTNTIPANTVTTAQGVTNILPATANVGVYAVGTGITGGKSFSPSTIDAGGNSRLRVDLRAPADTSLTNFSFTDILPAGVTISNSQGPSVSSGCGPSASLTAVTGTDTISLTNGTIAAGALCRVDVWVTSSTPGTVTNTIPPSNITNDQNRTPAGPLTSNLTVQALSDFSMSKTFSPSTVAPNGISTLTITLQNTNTSPIINVSLTDNLPGTTANNSVFVAPTPNASTTCGGGVITATPGSQTIQMTGGTVPAQVGGIPGVCTISVDVRGSTSTGNRNNIIPTTNVSGTLQSTGAAISPAQDASARLVVSDISIGLVKGFNPLTVFGGSASTMSVLLINPNSSSVSGIGFTDTMPAGMFLASPTNFSVNSCGGTISGNPGDGSFTFSGGSLSANSSCTLTLSVTMNVNGNLTNVIPAGAISTSNGVTNPDPAEATLTNLAGASVSKAFAPNPIAAGSYSLLTITIQNTSNVPLTGMGLADTLPAGVTVSGAPAPAPVNNCGGTLSAVSGGQNIQLTNGSLSANSACTMVVGVTGSMTGDYENIIPVGSLTNNENATNNQPAIDTLTITGATVTAALGDFVWLDANMDGIQDAGEIGVANVTVRLLDQNGNQLATTTTDANGFYSFTGLTPGTYRVDFVPPAGYTVSPANQGVNDALDSDADPITGETANVTLAAGETNNTLDAGLFLQSPGIQVTKTIAAVNFVSPNIVRMTYSIQVLNTGNVTLSGIQVTDDLTATFPVPATYSIISVLSGTLSVNAGFNGDTDINLLTGTNTLAPGANGVITLVVQVDTAGVDATYTNTVDAQGSPPSGPDVQDSDSVPGPFFIDPALTKSVDPAIAAVGDLVTYTITVTNNGNVPANGVVVTDPLPSNLEYVSAASLDAATTSPRGTITLIPPRTIQVDIGTLDVNDVVLITIIARVNSQGQPPIQNQATLVASAPPQNVSPDPLPNNTDTAQFQIAGAGGGGGGGGGGGTGGGGTVGVGLAGFIPVTGFAPGRVTNLSGLPVTKYNSLSDVTLEIPVLKLELPIVGVPMKDKTWDVNWLLNQAGWLQGSAFPGFSGNTVLTSHVTLAYGQAGPFANLHKLKIGDKIFVRSYGDLYIYEVRSISELNALDPSILRHEDKSWLTLVTCADYNEKAETYLKRLVVKAELVEARPNRWWSAWP